jgi:hypothetical protein
LGCCCHTFVRCQCTRWMEGLLRWLRYLLHVKTKEIEAGFRFRRFPVFKKEGPSSLLKTKTR